MSTGEAIVVVANSARLLAEIGRADGFEVIALDMFGDRDTRAAASAWYDLRDGSGLRFDAGRLLGTLQTIASRRVRGWVAGSGFEANLALLQAGAEVLPLLGNPPGLVARVRDPGHFHARLSALGITHPETRVEPPADASGWLFKDAHACGGWHVRAAAMAPARAGAGAYYQREVRGTPMSVLLLADGRRWRALGYARQIVRPIGRHRHVFHGSVGPVMLPAVVRAQVDAMIDKLVPEFGLRGLNGLDFMLVGERALVLELNPRPTASLALFDRVIPGGVLRAHADVCQGAPLPAFGAAEEHEGVRASEIVYASRSGVASRAFCDWLGGQSWSRDRPLPGTPHGAGEPLCSVLASAESSAAAEARLKRRRLAVLDAVQRLP